MKINELTESVAAQVNSQDIDVNVVVDKLQNFVSNAEQQIQNADYNQQVRYATVVRDRALAALNMIEQGGNTSEAARAAFRFMQTGNQSVAEGRKYKCTCHPGDSDPDCPVHGLEPMEVGDALDVKKVVAEGQRK